jgi:hypothetical protein
MAVAGEGKEKLELTRTLSIEKVSTEDGSSSSSVMGDRLDGNSKS